MRKRYCLAVVMLIGAMALAAGCSSGKNTEKTAEEQSVLTGVMDEIKDFMFVVVDDEDNPYAFGFDGDKPKGLDEVKEGDRVKVTYTGEISVVDPFEGEIISVEKN